MRKVHIVCILALSIFLSACGPRGSGDMAVDIRGMNQVRKVALSGVGTLIITQGTPESLRIEAQEYVLRHIETPVRDGVLQIRLKSSFFGEIIPTKPITYRLTVADLDAVNLIGAGKVSLSNLETERLEIEVSGVGSVWIDSLSAGDLDVDLSGAGTVTVSGQVTDQEVLISSVGEYLAGDLQSHRARVMLTGAGLARVWAEEALEVNISGLGSVEYFGNPALDTQITGLGRLVERGER